MVSSSAVTLERNKYDGEAALVRSAQNGDSEAFNHLVLSYQDRIYTLAVRILGDTDLAEDIAQNTFVTAYLNLPRFRNGSFRSWLYRIATNLCYDEHRRHKRFPISSLESEDTDEERITPLDDFHGSANLLPEAALERHELAQTVQKALHHLDPSHRAVLVLVDQMELEYQEAAQILKIPVGTVKSRLARARLKLHHLLDGVFEDSLEL